MEQIITVLTPSYNRRDKLENLYISLKNQTDKRFVWMVIDDGSSDGTDTYMYSVMNETEFEIIYQKKENGGKHTALNLGFALTTTYLTFIVDSDDVLTKDAISQICKRVQIIKEKNLAGIAFLRGYSELQCIGSKFPKDEAIMNDIDVRIRKKICGDKAEVWRSDILKRYRFPVHEGEKFQGENYVWWQIARQYNMLYVNRIIYITEYLEDGLTKAGRALRLNNPIGGMENCNMAFYPEFPLHQKIKCAILYDVYGYCAKWPIIKICKSSGAKYLTFWCLIPARLLYHCWIRKYLINK